jgi:hypothetical protein
MLPIGRLSKNGRCHGEQNRYTNFTKDEQYTLMTLWGIFGSPLMIGGNMPENDEFTLSLLTNAEYMKMHRERKNSKEILRNESSVIWAADGNGCKYIALFNTSDKTEKIKAELGGILPDTEERECFDIWENTPVTKVSDSLSCEVASHGAKLFKINL